MKKFFKIAASTLGLMLLALLAAALIVPQVIDPNDYRERIAQEVKTRTGRQLTLNGPIELSLFPWLGLALKDAALSNAPGFGDEPQLRVGEARVKVRILPLLLRRDLEVDTVVLRQPEVHLAINASGKSNWQDLTAGSADAANSKSGSGKGMGRLRLGGVEMTGANVIYDDRQAGTRMHLRKLDLTLGALTPGAWVPLHAQGTLDYASGGISNAFELDAQVRADPATQKYAVDDLELRSQLTGEGMPKEGLPVLLKAALDADLARNHATVQRMELGVLDARIHGAGELSDLKGTPTFAGKVELASFSPREVLEKLGMKITTADSGVLASAGAQFELRASAKAVDVKNLRANLDDTELTGAAAVQDFDRPRVRFELALGTLDVDRYLAPTKKPSGDGGGEPQAPTTPQPVAARDGVRLDELGKSLARYDLRGTLALEQLKISNVKLSNAQLTLTGKSGNLAVDPLRASLYDGTLAGSLALSTAGPVPVVSARQQLSGVSLEPLLKDFLGKSRLSGRSDVSLDLRAQGVVTRTLVETLAGQLRLDVADGTLKGINIDRAICQAQAASALARGKTQQACDPNSDSRFEVLKVSAQITDGIARSEDLTVIQPRYREGDFYQITGAGQINLPRQEVDYLVRAVRTRRGEGSTEAQEKGAAIPVRVAGTFDHLSVRPDLKGVAKEQAVEKIKEKYGDRLEAKENDSDLEKSGKELLKGLLGR